jgi:cytochrome P450
MTADFTNRINTNAYRQCFWCLAYLLHEPELLEAVKAEIRPGYKSDTLDMSYLLQNCPLLASFYEEMLRVNNEYVVYSPLSALSPIRIMPG